MEQLPGIWIPGNWWYFGAFLKNNPGANRSSLNTIRTMCVINKQNGFN